MNQCVQMTGRCQRSAGGATDQQLAGVILITPSLAQQLQQTKTLQGAELEISTGCTVLSVICPAAQGGGLGHLGCIRSSLVKIWNT